MTVTDLNVVPTTLALRGDSRCLLCGEIIARGARIKNAGLYDKAHADCAERAAAELDGALNLTFKTRSLFLALPR